MTVFPYQDRSQTAAQRVADLLSRMTLEEKVGQTCLCDARERDDAWFAERGPGALFNIYDPALIARLQRELGLGNRLGIPFFFVLDCPHGHAFPLTTTVFPSSFAMSCSWNPELVRQAAVITAREMRGSGVNITDGGPDLDVVRDLRWGRVDETYGEDPFLVGEFGAAVIRGVQGDEPHRPTGVIACPKHFMGYSETIGSRDGLDCQLSERALRWNHLPPYVAVLQAGAIAIMAGYHAWDGVPCSANKRLLTGILREELGFDGFVMSDWNNAQNMVATGDMRSQRVAADLEEAVPRCLDAGNEMTFNVYGAYEAVLAAVKAGRLRMEVLDEAVRRILSVKFRMGLFDGLAMPDPAAEATWGCAEHQAVAEEAALQSAVLLENHRQTLPIGPEVRTIAVIGPNAEDPDPHLGCWTNAGNPAFDAHNRNGTQCITVLQALRAHAAATGRTIVHHAGCGLRRSDADDIDAAVHCCKHADLIVAVVGDSEHFRGEERDRARMDLLGRQKELLEAALAVGKPLVVIVMASKPPIEPWLAHNSGALIAAFNPGGRGGPALVKLLFGERDFSGRLTASWAHHVGQLPVTYNQFPGWHGPQHYNDLGIDTKEALYSFGQGRHYGSVTYTGAALSNPVLVAGEALVVELDLRLDGSLPVDEVVQVYVGDDLANVTRPARWLAGYQRVALTPGISQRVRIEIPYERLAIVGVDGKRVVEPGAFTAWVGSSSRPGDCTALAFSVKNADMTAATAGFAGLHIQDGVERHCTESTNLSLRIQKARTAGPAYSSRPSPVPHPETSMPLTPTCFLHSLIALARRVRPIALVIALLALGGPLFAGGGAKPEQTAHNPNFADKEFWPADVAKTAYSKETWKPARVLVFAKTGDLVNGGWRSMNIKDIGDAEHWTENGKPAADGPDEDTDVIFPDSKNYYSTGKAEDVGGLVARHITVGSNCDAKFGGLEIHGNVLLKPGGRLFGHSCRFVGDKNTFLMGDNPTYLANKTDFAKTGEASVEVLGRWVQDDELRLRSGTLIIGPDTQYRSGDRGANRIFPGTSVVLMSGAILQTIGDKYVGKDWVIGGNLRAGTTDRPLTKDATIGLSCKVRGDLPYPANVAPSPSPSDSSLFLNPTGSIAVVSADPKTARLVFRWVAEKHRNFTPDGMDTYLHRETITMTLLGKTDLNGVEFRNVRAGGIMMANPTYASQWKNVTFGEKNEGPPDKLIVRDSAPKELNMFAPGEGRIE